MALGLAGASDESIWQAAIQRQCTLVTKDEDFHRLSILRGAPPKVIWMRLGNCTTSDIENLLRRHFDEVVQFVLHQEATFLELGGASTE